MNEVLGRAKGKFTTEDIIEGSRGSYILDTAAEVGSSLERTGTNENHALPKVHFIVKSFVRKKDKKLLESVCSRKIGRQTSEFGEIKKIVENIPEGCINTTDGFVGGEKN